MTVDEVVAALGLRPLDQEGGWFRQTINRGPEVDARAFGPGFPAGPRPQVTAILAAIGGDQFSAMHRLKVDEIWMFHMGDPLEMLMLHPDGREEEVVMGHDLAAGQRLQHVVPAGCWQGSTARAGGFGYAVVSCLMVPGFAWEDFELGRRATLQRSHPGAAERIARLTRERPAEGAL